MDLDDSQRSLDAERAERIDGILSREPADMGMNGACHVVALILKEMFPAYDIVAAKDAEAAGVYKSVFSEAPEESPDDGTAE